MCRKIYVPAGQTEYQINIIIYDPAGRKNEKFHSQQQKKKKYRN